MKEVEASVHHSVNIPSFDHRLFPKAKRHDRHISEVKATDIRARNVGTPCLELPMLIAPSVCETPAESSSGYSSDH